MKETEDSKHGFPNRGPWPRLLCLYCSKNFTLIYAVRYTTYFSTCCPWTISP